MVRVLSLALLIVAVSTGASALPGRTLQGLVDKVVDTAQQTIGAVTGICEDNVFYLFDATAANTPSQVNAIDLSTGKLLGVAVTPDQQLQGYGFVAFDTLQNGSTIMYVGADNKSSEYGLLSAFNFPSTNLKGGGVPQFPLTRISPDPVAQDAANVASRIGLTNAVLFYGDSLYIVDGGTPLDDVGENTLVVPGKISRYERYPPYTYIGDLDTTGIDHSWAVVSPTVKGNYYPTGGVFGPDGYLYVTAAADPYDIQYGSIFVFDVSQKPGKFLKRLANNNDTGCSSLLNIPTSPVFDAYGHLNVVHFKIPSSNQYDGVLAFDILTGQCLREAVRFETVAEREAGLQNRIFQITRAPGTDSPFVGSIFNASQPELFIPGIPLVASANTGTIREYALYSNLKPAADETENTVVYTPVLSPGQETNPFQGSFRYTEPGTRQPTCGSLKV